MLKIKCMDCEYESDFFGSIFKRNDHDHTLTYICPVCGMIHCYEFHDLPFSDYVTDLEILERMG